MYSYKVKFITLKDTIAFEIKSDIKENVEEFVNDILLIFAKIDGNEKPVIEALQKNTTEIRKRLETFNDKYKAQLPQLNGVPAFFRKLNEGEQFFFLPNVPIDAIHTLKIHNYLRAVAENKSFEEIDKQTTDLFGEIITKYQITAFGDKENLLASQLNQNEFVDFVITIDKLLLLKAKLMLSPKLWEIKH